MFVIISYDLRWQRAYSARVQKNIYEIFFLENSDVHENVWIKNKQFEYCVSDAMFDALIDY